MLSISPPIKGAACAKYYVEQAVAKYYGDSKEEPGRWFGEGAALLALQETVSATAFKNLLEGRSVDGQQAWVQNAGDADRQKAWDLTFSAPKAVSVLWACSEKEVRGVIEQCVREATTSTLSYVEREAGITRRGKGGQIKEKAGLVFATFLHTTSRAQDPQLHTHAVLINLALREDGTTGSLRTVEIFRLKMTAGAMFRRELAARLEQRLGLTIEPESVGFHIRGVPKDLCEVFSKRSRAIRKVLEQRGQTGAVAAKVVTLITRMRKQVVSRPELFASWRNVANAYGWSADQARQLIHSGKDEVPSQRLPAKAREDRAQEAVHDATPQSSKQSRPDDRHHNQASGADNAKKGNTRTTEKMADPRSGDGQTGKNSREESSRRQGAQDNAGDERRQQSGRAGAGAESRGRASHHDGRRSEHQQQPQPDKRAEAKIQPNAESTWRDPLDLPFIRIERRPLFPNAPFWSPVKNLKPPRIVVGRPPRPRWAKVSWRKDLVFAHFRVQQRRVFRRAPKWNPLHNLTVPAFRLAPVPQIPKSEPPHTWGSVLWEKPLGRIALRVQKRRLFARAYRSTRAGRLELPALRFVRNEKQQQHSH